MDRDALDEFFRHAEDVLEDWDPDPEEHPDVMAVEHGPEGEEPPELPVVDSYYEQVVDTDWDEDLVCSNPRCVLCRPGPYPRTFEATFVVPVSSDQLTMYLFGPGYDARTRATPIVSAAEVLAATFGSAFARAAERLREALEASVVPLNTDAQLSGWWAEQQIRAAALEARRSRNTGPPQGRMIDDGRRRRAR